MKSFGLMRKLWTAFLLAASSVVGARAQSLDSPPVGYLGPPQFVESAAFAAEATGAASLTNVRVHNTVGDAPNHTQSETSLAINPANTNHRVACFHDSRLPSAGQGITRCTWTTDGGLTWTQPSGGLPKISPSSYGVRGDPVVVAGPNNKFYAANLYVTGATVNSMPFQLAVHQGEIVGGTLVWNTPRLVTSFTSGFGADKDQMDVDLQSGTIYVSYSNFTAGNQGQIEVVRSTDEGQTWSSPVVLAAASTVVHQGSIPRVGPDGELYVAWEDGFAQGVNRSIHIRKSTSWPTFGPDVLVSNLTETANPPSNSRTNEFPTMAVDTTSGANRGRVYVSFADGSFGGSGRIGAVVITHSANGSAGSWSPKVRLDDDTSAPSATGTHRWFPWMAITGLGEVQTGWYDRRLRPLPPGNQTMTDVFAARFTPTGGVSTNFRITDQSFPMNVPSAITPNFGDYNGAAATATGFFYLWGDGRGGNPDTFTGGTDSPALSASPPAIEACAPGAEGTTLIVRSGPGLFSGPLLLALASISPPEPTISVLFAGNPVTPTPEGTRVTMAVVTPAETPVGVYTVTVSATDGIVSATAQVTVTRSQKPGAVSLLSPANGAAPVSRRPTFTWSAAPGATRYRLQVFVGADCVDGNVVRNFENLSGTQFTLPVDAALNPLTSYSWRVTAQSLCGETISEQCFNLTTGGTAVTWRYINLGTIAGTAGAESAAWAINNAANGDVVGASTTLTALGRAFLWRNGVFTNLGAIFESFTSMSVAYGVNEAADVVGQTNINATQPPHAFLWRKGVMTDLGTLSGVSGSYSRAWDINNGGKIVGESASTQLGAPQAFLHSNGTFTALGALPGNNSSIAYAINDSDVIVGSSSSQFVTPDRAFRRSAAGVLTALQSLGGVVSRARAINNAGVAAGLATTSGEASHAALWPATSTVPVDLGHLGGGFAEARSINENSEVVGVSTVAGATVGRAFYWTNGDMVDLNTVIDPPLPANILLIVATGINNGGRIVGTTCSPPGCPAGAPPARAFLLIPN